METLNQFNNKFLKEWNEIFNKKDMAGVLCNQCGTEMFYPSKTMLASYPPKRDVKCDNCGNSGYKYGG